MRFPLRTTLAIALTACFGSAHAENLLDIDDLDSVTALTRHLRFTAGSDSGERFTQRHARAAG